MAIDVVRNKTPGLLLGSKIDSIFLPNNKILDEYKISNNPSLFTFKCAAYRAPEMNISAKKGEIGINAINDPASLAEFEFIYSQETFSMSHNHKWNEPTGIIGTVKKFFDEGVLGLGGNTILAAIQGAQQLVNDGNTSIRTDWNAFGSLDLAKSYQGTDASDVTIPFVLFTSTDPFYDVVVPATFLTYMSYPKLRAGKNDISELLSILNDLGTEQGAKAQLSKSNLNNSQNFNLLDKAGASLGNLINSEQSKKDQIEKKIDVKDVLNKVKDATKDKWRYRLGFSPPSWVVSSSNGTVFLNNAALTNVNVVYHGPWISSKNIKATLSPSMIQEVFAGNEAVKVNSEGGLSGFPSWAEVTLTFKNNFEQVFGEEWMMGIAAGSSHFPKVSYQTKP